jgi:hypothetical protein
METVALLFALVLLLVCSFAPGFFLVRRFRWTPIEKLCGSVGLSLILLYLAAWAIYVLAPRCQPAAYFAISTVCAVLAAIAWRDLRVLFGIAQVRRALAGFGFLLVWSWSLLAMIRVYSGAGWTGDWLEHFQRCLFFLQRFPVDTAIVGHYQLSARPPLMNVLGAFFLGQAGDGFDVFQFVFLFLNLLPFLACRLLMPALGGPGKRLGKWAVLPLVGLFAMSPLVMESATYTWTKALAAFFAILGLWFYLAALRKGDSRRRIAAFLALSAGLLTHYSAGPYLVILTLHYLFTTFRKRPARYKEAGAIAVPCGLLLFTWFGWSLAVYGAQATFASNTSVTSSREYRGSTLEKIAGNVFDTVVPGIVRNGDGAQSFDQPNPAGIVRDNAFMVYQTNLIFGMGIAGGPLVVWLLVGLLRRKRNAGPEGSFWLVLIPAAVVLGIAVVGERDSGGVAHLTLLPVEILGLTWLAANFYRRRWVAWLILAGSLVDFPLGVMLNARVENLENRPGHTVYGDLSFANKGVPVPIQGPESLSQLVWYNWYLKHQYAMARQWLSELDRQPAADPSSVESSARARSFLERAISNDKTLWQGWYSRHGGSTTYFGDGFGEGWTPCSLLLALWLGLLWIFWRHIPPATIRVPVIAPRDVARLKARGKTSRRR